MAQTQRRAIAGGPFGVSLASMQNRTDSAFLLAQAARCRRLADAISESDMRAKLRELAAEYELQANGSKRRLLDRARRPSIAANLK
jgi:hypothetical protein